MRGLPRRGASNRLPPKGWCAPVRSRPYPPSVPLLWPGEKITRAHIELIRERWYNEIGEITVVIG